MQYIEIPRHISANLPSVAVVDAM